METNLLDLRRRVGALTVTSARLQGVAAAHQKRSVELTAQVGAAKARQALHPEFKNMFNSLQLRAHDRSVGTFERALTKLLNDVLPDEGKIRFLPSYKDSTTWLDINIENDGDLEDILEGNGGAVNNVVATGLRFTALMRTRNRKFMVLDEPDCWIKEPEKNIALIRVIAQVSVQTGIQTIFVSHFNDPSVFEGLVNVVKLVKDADGNPQAQVVQPLVHQWTDDTQPGIRGIELTNVGRHVKTFIPCFPGPTVIIGTHNLGKSTAVSRALRAVSYGFFDDSLIRHKTDESRIVVHLENKVRVEAVRQRKKSPALMYRVYENSDTASQEARQARRNTVPDFVESTLGISLVDDFDVQLNNQKLPVFLLNETAARRAQILSIGRESGHLKTLMKEYERMKSEDDAMVKTGESELARLTEDLNRLVDLPQYAGLVESLKLKLEHLETLSGQRELIGTLLGRIDEANTRLAKARQEAAVLDKLPSLPVLADADRIKRLADRIEHSEKFLANAEVPALPQVPRVQDASRAKQLADIIERGESLLGKLQVPTLPAVPVLKDTAIIVSLGKRITASESRLRILATLPESLPAVPVLRDGAEIQRILMALVGAQSRLATANEQARSAATEEHAAQEQLKTLKKEMGVCPLCDTHFEEHEAHAHQG
ncbi:hypothetical protein [Burkholderia cenocepacia]|uniref:hypothetical protein n=1 Tax=Burkholderia cenocepacia TaxID=95486 RepID=UPI00076D83CB|nr:hypothetical protein [Burkholderia cenocepacia]KWU17798.1 hypothetical protein AS149_13845 [Burkholderia cenocepacia]